MDCSPGTKNRVLDREFDLQLLLDSVKAKPFAISPPIEVENSFIMGLANDDLNEGICIHLLYRLFRR